MDVTETNLVKLWIEATEILNGTFEMPIQTQNFGVATEGIYHFKIDVPYKHLVIRIYSGIADAELFIKDFFCNITIATKKPTRDKIELSIWRKDFLDKIFGNNLSRTEYEEFDKVIGLKASRNIERYLPKIFENVELRKELINDKYRTYNIQTIDSEIIVQI